MNEQKKPPVRRTANAASAPAAKSAPKKAPAVKKKIETKRVNLALQGGGAHGAFTWGVIDRLLEDERVDIEAVSGTSAGAMNAVVAADGLMHGGREGARAALKNFWQSVSEAAHSSPIKRSPIDVFMGNWSLDTSPTYLIMDLMNRVASPYQLNPLNINPLKDVLAAQVDFESVRCCNKMQIFVSATNVETGRVRVFERPELTCDMVMASACLPFMFQAVEIDGVPYWDGGYTGNPALFPFYERCQSRDIVIVQINPLERTGTPTNARDILNRMNEITFNTPLMAEYRAIRFVSRLIDEGRLDPKEYKQVLMHRISADACLKPMSASSKLNAEWAFLTHLFEIGHRTADNWLDANYEALGNDSTVLPEALYMEDTLDCGC